MGPQLPNRFIIVLQMGQVSPADHTAPFSDRPPRATDDNNDLPRLPKSPDFKMDRAAGFGEPRNHENLIISQLQVAFLRAHNPLVSRGHKFAPARKLLRQHYQHIVIHDFLKRIADPQIVDDILQNGNRVYDVLAEPFFLPLEFSVAVYRFGHSMVQADYNFNLNFNRHHADPAGQASLTRLFMLTAFSGQLNNYSSLPENWIIEWDRFIDGGENNARRIDTKLVEPLFQLTDVQGMPEQGDGARLAVRNLLRGYLLRCPPVRQSRGR